jgi:uncharacterized protein (TIGR02996 family)
MSDATGEMLLRAIVEDPDADDLRLIYADWLHDHGDAARAEFIRVQVRLATMDSTDPERCDIERRVAELLGANRRRWWAEVPGGLDLDHTRVEFRRGFPQEFWVTSLDPFWDVAEAVSTGTPLARLELSQATENLPRIAACPALASVRRLAISGNYVRLAHVTTLLESPYLSRVQDLQVGCSEPGDTVASLVASWPGATSLRKLTLYPDTMPAAGVATLLAAPALRNLRELGLNGTGIDTDGVRALVSVNSPPPLEELFLARRGEMDEEGFRLLARWPGLARVRHLQLSRGGPSDDLAKAACLGQLALSPHLGALHTLELGSSSVGPVGARVLARMEALRNLRSLWLACNPLGDEGIRVLASATHWGALQHLCLWQTQIGDVGLRALARAPILRPTHLNLEDNPIGPEGLAALAASPVLERIQSVELGNTQIGDAGLVTLAAGHLGERVAQLHLSWCGIGEEGIRALARAAWGRKLRKLDLSSNRIGDAGGVALASSSVLVQLLDLDLSSTGIGDETARALASWPGTASLYQLALGGNQITDAGLRALAASPYLDGIDVLNVWHNPVTREGLEPLWDRFGLRVYPQRRQWEGED